MFEHKILSKEEEIELFVLYSKGDMRARELLIIHNTRLVSFIAHKYVQKDVEDAISVGFIALIRAVDGFDYTKGMKFSSYCTRVVSNEIINYLKSVSNDLSHKVLIDDSVINQVFSDRVHVEEQVVGEMYNEYLLSNLKKGLLEKLTDDELFIITSYYGIGCDVLTQGAIGDIVDMKRRSITYCVKKILKKLKFDTI